MKTLALLLLLAVPAQAGERKAMTIDGVLMGAAMFADIRTTDLALGRCDRCFESNPITKSRSGGIALHAAAWSGLMLANHQLRKHGHPEMARGITVGTVAAFVGVAICNHYKGR